MISRLIGRWVAGLRLRHLTRKERREYRVTYAAATSTNTVSGKVRFTHDGK